MTRRFWYCDATTGRFSGFENFADDTMVPTAIGSKRADTFSGCDKATTFIHGLEVHGGITYTTRHGGAVGNTIRVVHALGDTGPGHELRQLAVGIEDTTVTATFGTDGTGGSVIPTAAEVVALLTANTVINDLLVITYEGDGDGRVNTASDLLEGGADNGDVRKYLGRGGYCRRVSTVEVM